jgi:hypothetical protein
MMGINQFRVPLFIILLSQIFYPQLYAQNRSIWYDGLVGEHTTINGSADSNSKFNFSKDTFTIEAWIYPTIINGGGGAWDHTIVGNDSANFNNNSKGFAFCVTGDSKLSFSSSGNTGGFVVKSTGVLTKNQWQHVAVTKRGRVVLFYINGVPSTASNLLGDSVIKKSTKPLRIGENGALNYRRFYGKIDEVKIWNSQRTPNEIKEDMILSCTPYPASLIAYFHMDDTGSITPVKVLNQIDTLSNGSHGAVIAQTDGAIFFKPSNIIYVDSSNISTSCNAQDGTSWATAFSNLNDAIYVSHIYPGVQQILVAKGTYHPSLLPFNMQSNRVGVQISSADNRDKTFHIRAGIEIYGGYPSGGGIRDWVTNTTVLDGSSVGGIMGDTAYHILMADSSDFWDGSNDSTIIDGFYFKNGNANENNTVNVNYKVVYQYNGSAMHLFKNLFAVRNNIFVNNLCAQQQGAVFLESTFGSVFEKNRFEYNSDGCIQLATENCLVNDNEFRYNYGNVISGGGLNVKIINNKFEDNQSFGGTALTGKFSLIKNNIFLRNKAGNGQSQSNGGVIFMFQNNGDSIDFFHNS